MQIFSNNAPWICQNLEQLRAVVVTVHNRLTKALDIYVQPRCLFAVR